MAITDSAREIIEDLLDNHQVVLFMKGNPQMPQCGFSANASRILSSLVPDYATFDVLSNEEVREGIKEYGNWPTIPQLYIDRELVGGSDIIGQLFNAGELHEMLGLEKPDRTPPEISISEAAAEAIRNGMASQPGADLHFQIDDYWRAQFMLQPSSGHEIVVEAGGVELHMDVLTAQRAKGVKIDFVESFQGTGLSVDIPLAPPPVKHLSVTELKAKLDGGDDFLLIDNRPEEERAKAALDGALPLTGDLMKELDARPRDTELVFICHTGRSSAGVAEHFRKEGFTDVATVDGGIDAWSREIDSSVPVY